MIGSHGPSEGTFGSNSDIRAHSVVNTSSIKLIYDSRTIFFSGFLMVWNRLEYGFWPKIHRRKTVVRAQNSLAMMSGARSKDPDPCSPCTIHFFSVRMLSQFFKIIRPLIFFYQTPFDHKDLEPMRQSLQPSTTKAVKFCVL